MAMAFGETRETWKMGMRRNGRKLQLAGKRCLLALAVAVPLLAGACQSMPGADGRYADFDRGRSNFRAALSGAPGTADL
jgi:hypothetical protein